MLIPVMYQNGKHDLVKEFMLSRLIDERDIVKFKRSNGWINISTDNIRNTDTRPFYNGEERRQTELATAELVDIF